MVGMTAQATRRQFDAWASVLLVLLTLGGVESVYRLSSFLWMASAEPAHIKVWLTRIYVWLALSLFIGATWIGLLIMVVRDRRRLK
jgi:hypothetical protein